MTEPTRRELWMMPTWMEPYRKHIVDPELDVPVEGAMNYTPDGRLPAMINAIIARVNMLNRLHQAGLLVGDVRADAVQAESDRDYSAAVDWLLTRVSNDEDTIFEAIAAGAIDTEEAERLDIDVISRRLKAIKEAHR